jgi:antitoxin HicB
MENEPSPSCSNPKKRAGSPCVPAFPEIVTYGKDEREALAMAEDAIRLVITDSVARGEPVPGGEPPRIREVTVTLAA